MSVRLRDALVTSFLAVVLAVPPCAAADDPLLPNEAHWRLVLQRQLKADQGCSLNEVLTVQEVPLGDDVGQDGRISCFDGREFTFTRKGKQQPFKIEACTPTVC
jgi:hypothetical protein